MQFSVQHLLVPCTNRKSIQPSLSLCNYRDLKEWKRDCKARVPEVFAKDLYMGSAWSKCLRASMDLHPEHAWVVSAGLGLVQFNDMVPSYSATFQVGHKDSVPGVSKSDYQCIQKWWVGLSGNEWWKKLVGSGIVVVQLSESYLNALEPGLIQLGDEIGDRLMIVSPGMVGYESSLHEFILPIDTRIEHVIPTTRGDSGATALKWIGERFAQNVRWNPKKFRKMCKDFFGELPPIRTWSRRKIDDDEISSLIRAHYLIDGCIGSPSSHLRRLRDSGIACEQSRMRRIYSEVFRNV